MDVRRQRRPEEGLALLDVLLGMAIFALIAVIAVQAMGMYRDRAAMTQATSDVKQLSTGVAAALTEPGAAVDDVPAGELNDAYLDELGVNLTDTDSRAFAFASTTVDGVDVCVENEGAFVVWRADGGTIVESGAVGEDANCGAVFSELGELETSTLSCPAPGDTLTMSFDTYNFVLDYHLGTPASQSGATVEFGHIFYAEHSDLFPEYYPDGWVRSEVPTGAAGNTYTFPWVITDNGEVTECGPYTITVPTVQQAHAVHTF